jgi:transposase InsO family protein
LTRIVDTLRSRFGVGPVCREIGVAVSSYYHRKARERDPSMRSRHDVVLTAQIITARTGRRQSYGQKRTWLELADRGVDVGRDRVARLMRANGLVGVRRGRRHVTTIPDGSALTRPADLVDRDFTASGPNRLWVADFTYLRTVGGFIYLAFILDAYSRMIVGWQLASHRRSTLVTDALEMAIFLRDPEPGLVAHTDAGSQYTSIAYTDRVAEAGMLPSIGSVGDALDNAMAESWVATIKAELVQGRIFTSFEQAEHEVLAWISFYNHQRLHASLGYLSPVRYEAGERRHKRPFGPRRPVQPALLGSAGQPGGNNQ